MQAEHPEQGIGFGHGDYRILAFDAECFPELLLCETGVLACEFAELSQIGFGRRNGRCRRGRCQHREDEVHVGMDELGHPAARGTVELFQKADGHGKGPAAVVFMKQYGVGNLPRFNHGGKYLFGAHFFLVSLKCPNSASRSLVLDGGKASSAAKASSI